MIIERLLVWVVVLASVLVLIYGSAFPPLDTSWLMFVLLLGAVVVPFIIFSIIIAVESIVDYVG